MKPKQHSTRLLKFLYIYLCVTFKVFISIIRYSRLYNMIIQVGKYTILSILLQGFVFHYSLETKLNA